MHTQLPTLSIGFDMVYSVLSVRNDACYNVDHVEMYLCHDRDRWCVLHGRILYKGCGTVCQLI